MSARIGLILGVVATLVSGCIGSELRRVTIDLDELRAWNGQTAEAAPDSMLPALIDLRAEILDFDSVVGIEEFSMFIQLQNVEVADPVNMTLYAHRERVVEIDDLIDTGIALSEPVFVRHVSSTQIDARTYPAIATGFEELRELALRGSFYLYLVGDGDLFHVVGNVPTVSFLVTVD